MTCVWRVWRVVAVVAAVVVTAILLSGVGALAQTVETSLHEMADAAGVIFVGQVTRVRRVEGGGTASGVVEVEFRVDRSVRGCGVGGTYVLREWAGLWSGGAQRYRVGQRLLMLLRAPNAAGMSSPVGGLDGAIPIGGVESELAGASSGVGGTSARPVEMVDLRWVGTKVVRPVAYAAEPPGGGRVGGVEARAETTGALGVPVASVTIAGSNSVGASVDAVVGMLGSWERARAGR